MASIKPIIDYIKEHYPDHFILGETQQKKSYDGLHGYMIKLKGVLWYIRVLPPTEPKSLPKVEFTRGNLVYKPNGEHF